MIKNWLITGDTHGRVESRLASIKENMPEYNPEETAVIILGDVGFQYYKNKKDWKKSFEPFVDDGIIAIDACTAYTGLCNVIVIEEDKQ